MMDYFGVIHPEHDNQMQFGPRRTRNAIFIGVVIREKATAIPSRAGIPGGGNVETFLHNPR